MIKALKIALILLLVCFYVDSSAQKQPKTRILFLLDASGSMYAKMDSDIRINVAKRLLSKMVDSLKSIPDLEIALRVYGHQSPKNQQNCKDTKLEVPFAPNNHDDIQKEIKLINPKGTTLIAYSLQQAAYDFPTKDGVRNIIILITDGIEECSGDPCAISEALQKQGVILKPFIIGLGDDGLFKAAFDCVGRYFDASTESSFENILGVVISQAINATTAQVNLLDINYNPTETNVNMSFYDSRSGRLIYNYYHTLNNRGLPDTMVLDPTFKYDLQVHTIPNVWKRDIEILAARHNIIAVDAPQGDLELKVDGITAYPRLEAIIRKSGTTATLHVQDFNTRQKYIVGTYDIEILTTPRIYLNNIKVDWSATKTINIPQPGKLNVVAMNDYYASIYQEKGGKMEWVADINPNIRKQVIIIQPGKYRLVYRPVKSTNILQTQEKTFEISSGGSTIVYLQ